MLELADSTTCYSFGYDSDFVLADDTVDEYLEHVGVDEVDDKRDIEPPIPLISFEIADDRNPATAADMIWRGMTDYVPYEYLPDDEIPKILMEPLTHDERLAMNRLLMLVPNTPDSASVTDSTHKNIGITATTDSNHHHHHHHSKDSQLKMVEIYKDPFTGRNKAKVHHITGEKESKTIALVAKKESHCDPTASPKATCCGFVERSQRFDSKGWTCVCVCACRIGKLTRKTFHTHIPVSA